MTRKKKTHASFRIPNFPKEKKDYDREMAVNTIKLLLKLGYEIKKTLEYGTTIRIYSPRRCSCFTPT